MADTKRIGVRGYQARGYFLGMLTAVCFSISPILLRKGLDELPAPFWASFIGLFAAFLGYIPFLIRQGVRAIRRRRVHIPNDSQKIAIRFQALAGLGAGLGTITRTLAIGLAPVVVAVPLTQTSPFFTVIFVVLLLGKEKEKITSKLVLASILIVLGSGLIVVGNNQ